MGSDYPVLTPKELAVLMRIYQSPRTLQSDYCRNMSKDVAKLASLGCITTFNGEAFANTWLISSFGIATLYSNKESK